MKKGIIAAAVITLLAVIVAASVLSGGPKGEKVYVEKASRKPIESIVSASGVIEPKLKVNISAHVVGKIEKLYFKEGDFVKRGARMVDLERGIYSAESDRRRAELANRRIEVVRARAALRNSEMQFKRARQMQEQGIQAEELFDRTELELENARALVASAAEGVRQASAALAQSDEDLARTTIHAPIDGRVVQLAAQEGEVVVTGTMNNPGSVIAVLADLSAVLVEAEVAETEVVKVKVGQSARIEVDAVEEKKYNGTVVEIGSSAAIKATSGSGIRYFKVKVAITDPDERLRPGMTSQVEIVTSRVEGALAVPVQSVVERVPGKKARESGDSSEQAKKKYAFVVKENKAVQTEVTTGVSSDTDVVILSGLKEGDQVVTGPFRTLKKLDDGNEVQVESEKKQKKDKDEDEDDEEER